MTMIRKYCPERLLNPSTEVELNWVRLNGKAEISMQVLRLIRMLNRDSEINRSFRIYCRNVGYCELTTKSLSMIPVEVDWYRRYVRSNDLT